MVLPHGMVCLAFVTRIFDIQSCLKARLDARPFNQRFYQAHELNKRNVFLFLTEALDVYSTQLFGFLNCWQRGVY